MESKESPRRFLFLFADSVSEQDIFPLHRQGAKATTVSDAAGIKNIKRARKNPSAHLRSCRESVQPWSVRVSVQDDIRVLPHRRCDQPIQMSLDIIGCPVCQKRPVITDRSDALHGTILLAPKKEITVSAYRIQRNSVQLQTVGISNAVAQIENRQRRRWLALDRTLHPVHVSVRIRKNQKFHKISRWSSKSSLKYYITKPHFCPWVWKVFCPSPSKKFDFQRKTLILH